MTATSTARLALVLAPLCVGCGAAGAGASPGGTFTAFATDFEGFHAWPSAPATPASTLPAVDGGDGVDGGALGDGGIHALPLTVYWKQAPPAGSAVFPVGTIIAKETAEAAPTARKIFAMVKRGGNFNPTGAIDWEWFELQNTADGGVVINWRGYGPPSGSSDIYGGDPTICNTCHLIAARNDDVWSSALQLTNF
jgi:hypothetical protein